MVRKCVSVRATIAGRLAELFELSVLVSDAPAVP